MFLSLKLISTPSSKQRFGWFYMRLRSLITYVEDILDDAPWWQLFFHHILAILAQLIDWLAGVAFRADILKVTLYFEMFWDSTVFLDGIRIDGGTCKLVYVVLKTASISTSKIRTNAITKTPLVSLIIMRNICLRFREKDTY